MTSFAPPSSIAAGRSRRPDYGGGGGQDVHLRRPAPRLQRVCEIDDRLLAVVRGDEGGHDRRGRIALMATPGPEYVAAMFAIWRLGCIAVPSPSLIPGPSSVYPLGGWRLLAVATACSPQP